MNYYYINSVRVNNEVCSFMCVILTIIIIKNNNYYSFNVFGDSPALVGGESIPSSICSLAGLAGN